MQKFIENTCKIEKCNIILQKNSNLIYLLNNKYRKVRIKNFVLMSIYDFFVFFR
jgi:hypothetical protein